MSKLYIYDATSSIDRKQAAGRFDNEKNVTQAGVYSVDDLLL